MARRRRYVRDSHGRFASVPGAPAAPQTAQTDKAAHAAKRAALRRQRATKAVKVTTAAVTVAAVVGASRSQYPARGAMAAHRNALLARNHVHVATGGPRRRIERTHVARARADHAKLSSLRASAFPTSVMSPRPFNAKAARAEARAVLRSTPRRIRR